MLSVYFTNSNRSILAEKELLEEMASEKTSAASDKSSEKTERVLRSVAGAVGAAPFQSRFFQ